jgi:addiction module HigA family antidote
MNITERRPTHPGKILLETVIKPLGLTVTEAARRLGISRQNLNDLIHEDTSLSMNMALRIAIATNTSPESWYERQVRLDLWEAMRNKPKGIKMLNDSTAKTA